MPTIIGCSRVPDPRLIADHRRSFGCTATSSKTTKLRSSPSCRPASAERTRRTVPVDLLIGRSEFGYTVRGDTLALDPVITATMRDEALAKPGKFTEAVWMVSVAVTGASWNRVDCAWC
jgi:hypothetical protein